MKINIVDFSGSIEFHCPLCAAEWASGMCMVEIVHPRDGAFFLAELCRCCGDPFPVVMLFDSQEPAQEVGGRVLQNLGVGSHFSSLPILSRENALRSFPLESFIRQ